MDLSDRPACPSVLFATSECVPLAKTGGLADVSAALPAALRKAGVDVRVLLPGYRGVLRGVPTRLAGHVAALGLEARLLEGELESGVPLLVLDCPALYDRPGGPYQDERGKDWPDNALRFGLLSRAAALLAGHASPLDWRPNVLHCNDWQTALAAVYCREQGSPVASVLTIHNLAFQGNFDAALLGALELAPRLFGIEGLEFYGRLSFLKGGLMTADALTTVSPTYAREIRMPAFGCGMDGILRHRADALSGILNGVDTSVWDPTTDPFLAATYSSRDLSSKRRNKREFQREMGLAVDDDVPLFAAVGRMTQQKGTDLILEAAPELLKLGQLALVGTGERELEEAAKRLSAAHPRRAGVRIGFSERLAHLLEAGADIFLMPSRYEPCGLNQMYSQRYGTPPIARATGGLADTVEDGKTGFLFDEGLAAAARRAAAAYRDPTRWRTMQRAGMARDFSWEAAARRYADLYLRLATRQPA
ncbi:MAG: glycogen synthase GlgA [Clostridia bacterium]